jgi:ribosomal protein S8
MISSIISQIKINLKKKKVVLLQKNTKVAVELLNALWGEKLICGYQIYKINFIKIYLKFNFSSKSIIKSINLISTQGRRLYMSIAEISKLKLIKEKTLYFFSTSKGILSDSKAMDLKVGGEILFSINT